MANSGYVVGVYSGRPSNDAILQVSRYAVSGNQSRWSWTLTARKFGSTSYVLDAFPWAVNVLGNTWSGSHNLDFRNTSSIVIASGITGWVNHDSGGYLNVYFSFSHSNVSIFGTASGSSNFAADRIVRPPGMPPTPTFQSATTTSISFNIGAPSDNGGAPISSYRLQVLGGSNFDQEILAWNSGASNQVASPLPPGSEYRIRYYAINSAGSSPWSNALTASTLPSVPPGMTVTPSISGTSASVALTPPQGVSSVTSYRVERRPIGGATVVYNSPTSPIAIPNLTPGSTHEYRASAFIGDYQTPWTDWVTVSQPQPNTNPGDYFDGSTPDKPDIDYQWNGTANNSTSRAVAKAPAGWRTFDDGNDDSGGLGVVIRATGGRSGAFGARVTFFSDTTAAGFHAGTSMDDPGATEVAENGVYWGSIYVSPSKAQRMAAELIWLDAGYNEIGVSAVGDAQIVPADTMTRLAVQGTAPLGAVHGAVGWTDVAGDGWSLWQGGDTVMMDDAMASIGGLYGWFSGDTPDTAQWAYSWLGTPNASVSQATALDPDLSDPLADPDCPPIPSAPAPPAIADDCLDETGSWRRYWAIIPEDQIADWLDLVPTIAISTGALPARQVRIRTWRNPDGLPPADFAANEWEAEQIISYIPANTTLTIDGVAQRVWAEVNGAEAISADRLLYGTGGGPASWPVLSCGTAYLVSFDVPLDAPEGNLSIDVALTTRML